jgi:tRNA threonylcarbamoyladenosine biosynthesis protein TsaE
LNGIYPGDAQMREEHLVLEGPEATRNLGRALAEELIGSARPLLLLKGDLGAGKTCLVQGLAVGLGIEEPITSPTFALAQHYEGDRSGRATHLVHLDLYRLESPAAADELFAQEEEEARGHRAVLAVEWPDRLSFEPHPAWEVEFTIEAEGRRVVIRRPG